MNITLKELIITCALCIAAASSFAQAPADKSQRSSHGMKNLDTNRDKLISREEAKAHSPLAQNFDKIDADKDGQISRNEMKAFHQANKADQDNDGNISKAEAAAKPHLAQNFDKIDANKDGILTPAERNAAMATHKGQAKK
jgi:hypothetical protein